MSLPSSGMPAGPSGWRGLIIAILIVILLMAAFSGSIVQPHLWVTWPGPIAVPV